MPRPTAAPCREIQPESEPSEAGWATHAAASGTPGFHGRRARACDMCLAPYSGDRRTDWCLPSCPRHEGWTRRQVVAALQAGEAVPGLAHESRLVHEARAIVRRQVAEVQWVLRRTTAAEQEARRVAEAAARNTAEAERMRAEAARLMDRLREAAEKLDITLPEDTA